MSAAHIAHSKKFVLILALISKISLHLTQRSFEPRWLRLLLYVLACQSIGAAGFSTATYGTAAAVGATAGALATSATSNKNDEI